MEGDRERLQYKIDVYEKTLRYLADADSWTTRCGFHGWMNVTDLRGGFSPLELAQKALADGVLQRRIDSLHRKPTEG